MSGLFDDFETEIENARILEAVADDRRIKVPLTPYAQLKSFETQRGALSWSTLQQPGTIGTYLYRQYLAKSEYITYGQLLAAVDDYRRAHVNDRVSLATSIVDTYLRASAPSPSSSSSTTSTIATSMANSDHHEPILPPKSPKSTSVTIVSSEQKTPSVSRDNSGNSLLGGSIIAEELSHGETSTQVDDILRTVNDIQHLTGAVALASTLFDALITRIYATLLAPSLEHFKSSPFYSQMIQYEHYMTQPVNLSKFRVFRVLGRGAFGEVSAVQKKDTNALYAMKEMSLKKIKSDRSEHMVIREQQMLAMMQSPFVLNLRYSFTDTENAYFVFDLCSGGDLHYHLRRAPLRRFTEDRVRFYAAEILLGLQHIHSHNLVYRDLKPQNIMLTREGHTKISDMGLTVQMKAGRSIRQIAGTPRYWAPEVLSRQGTSKASDWWSYGVLIYELITGHLPKCRCWNGTAKGNSYHTRNSAQAIAAGYSKASEVKATTEVPPLPTVPLPPTEWCTFGCTKEDEANSVKPDGRFICNVSYDESLWSPEARDLVTQLLTYDPQHRLGTRSIDDIKNHAFFNGMDWSRLAALQVTPPFVPKENEVNAKSLDKVGFIGRSKFDKVKLDDTDKTTYENFTYVSNASYEREVIEALEKMERRKARIAEKKANSAAAGCCTIM